MRIFVKYYINHAKDLVEKVGYAPLPNEFYPLILSHFEQNKVGTRFQGILPSNMKIEEFWQKKTEF